VDAPHPQFYNTVRERVKREVFKGSEAKGSHRMGSEVAALAVLSFSAAAYTAYAIDTNPLTGAVLGLAGAWIGGCGSGLGAGKCAT